MINNRWMRRMLLTSAGLLLADSVWARVRITIDVPANVTCGVPVMIRANKVANSSGFPLSALHHVILSDDRGTFNQRCDAGTSSLPCNKRWIPRRNGSNRRYQFSATAYTAANVPLGKASGQTTQSNYCP